MIATLLEQLAALLLCSFVILFIVPGVLTRILYTAPRLWALSARGEIRFSGALLVSAEGLVWVGFTALVYAAVFFVSREAFVLVTTGPVALGCWVVGIAIVLVHLILYLVRVRKRDRSVHHRMRNIIEGNVVQADSLIDFASASTEAEVFDVLERSNLSSFDRRMLTNNALRRS